MTILWPHTRPAPWRETVLSSTLSGKPSGSDTKEASSTQSAWLCSWGCPWWWFSPSSSSVAIAAVAGHLRATNSQTRTRRKRKRRRKRKMKTSGSLLSPSSSRWRRDHHCLSSEQGGSVSSPWSRASFQPQRLGGAFNVMHSLPQITQPRDKFQTTHPNGWGRRVDNSYSVLAAMCPVSVPQAWTAVSGILQHKSTESMYICILDGFQLCIICMHIWTTGTWDRIFYLSHSHVIYIFAQIYILAEMCYEKICPDLGTYVQLSSHGARPYALSVYHSGWRWVCSIPIPT